MVPGFVASRPARLDSPQLHLQARGTYTHQPWLISTLAKTRQWAQRVQRASAASLRLAHPCAWLHAVRGVWMLRLPLRRLVAVPGAGMAAASNHARPPSAERRWQGDSPALCRGRSTKRPGASCLAALAVRAERSTPTMTRLEPSCSVHEQYLSPVCVAHRRVTQFSAACCFRSGGAAWRDRAPLSSTPTLGQVPPWHAHAG